MCYYSNQWEHIWALTFNNSRILVQKNLDAPDERLSCITSFFFFHHTNMKNKIESRVLFLYLHEMSLGFRGTKG